MVKSSLYNIYIKKKQLLLTYNSLYFGLIQRRFHWSLSGSSSSAPSLSCDRAGGQLGGAEQNCSQTTGQFSVIAPFHSPQLFLTHCYSLSQVHLPNTCLSKFKRKRKPTCLCKFPIQENRQKNNTYNNIYITGA